jgi:hypothetical protein
MTNAWPIAPITAKDLDFAVKNYDFTGLTASELGPGDNLLSDIDVLLTEFAASIAAQVALSSSLDDDLLVLDSILAAMNADDFESLLGDLASAAAAGDVLAAAGDSPLPIGSFFNTGA